MDTLAKRLRSARLACKLTQVELAIASGTKQSDISKLERGKILKSTALLALARALKRNPDWLDTGDGPEMEHTVNHGEHQVNQAIPTYVEKPSPATLAATLANLARYFEEMDTNTKRMAVSLISDLSDAPDTHGTVTQMIQLAMDRAVKQANGDGA